jgi:hypothetical protein
MRRNQTLCFGEVHHFLDGLFDGDLHAKRVLSLTNATLGVIKTTSLAVNTIGHGLALARGLATKHAIKQVDRLLSNEGIDIDAAASLAHRPHSSLKSNPPASRLRISGDNLLRLHT